MTVKQSSCRPAIRADIVDFFGHLPKQTVHAQVWELEDKVVAIAGYYKSGLHTMVFSDVDPALEVPTIRIWKEALKFMSEFKHDGICVADSGSGAFLKRLGWHHVETSADGEIFQWQVL